MILRFFAIFLLGLPTFSFCDDAAIPTLKKEKIPALPHVWFSGGLLCLKAQESGLDFANQSQGTASTNFENTSTITPHFKWNCGVRIDGGYQPKDWFYYANWTNVENTAHGVKSTNGSSGFFPVLSLSEEDTPADYVTSGNLDWRMTTHLVELGTILSWKPSKYFILKNRLGMRVASLDQRFAINYGGGSFSAGIDRITMRNNFFGAGPIIGVSPNITLPKGFSLVGEISSSALVGNFFVKQREKYLTESLFYDTQHMTRVRWTLDAKAALAWQMEFLYKALVFCTQVGWEWHEFYSQNELRHNSDFFNGNKNIILRGGFISFCLGF